MNTKHVLAGCGLLAMAACSSGGDSGTTPTNEPPTISFTTTAIALPKSGQSDLTVSVDDPDDDALTITWTITRGTLAAQNTARTVMRWSTPATVGTDTVVVRVSDGTVSRSVTAEVKVGTLHTNTLFPAGGFVKANSPYILLPPGANPRVTVPGGVTRVIEAGTELLIATESSFIEVLGTLQAHGTEDDPIVMRANNRTFNCSEGRGWWEGVRVLNDPGSDGLADFEHVEIRDGRWGVRLRDNASGLLRDCRLLCSEDAGILMESNGSLRVFDTRISDSVVDGIAIWAAASLPDSVRVEGCTIAFNGNAGIRMDLNDVTQAVPIVVEFNQIEYNETYGIALANSVFPDIHYNAFRGNGTESVLNLFLSSTYPDPVNFPILNATCNFWYSINESNIKASVWDNDDSALVHTDVDVNPFLSANPLVTPPNCTP
jgi:hypothetical protein